jgi:uncharacterized protein Yka (UPF0111/DUF47 family)
VKRHWLLPETPDVLGLLVHQGQLTLAGVEALGRWAEGDSSQASLVEVRQVDATEARRAVLMAIRRAFTTALEPEDLFELSERLAAVLTQAKDLVREAEMLAMAPDRAMADIAGLVVAGVRTLVDAMPDLARHPDTAIEAADAAVIQEERIEGVYRKAMSALVAEEDLREVSGRRELYRRSARIGEATMRVAHRYWYAVVKRG